MATAAPTLNKQAIYAATSAGTQNPNADRVLAALQFGWALEELIARSRLASFPVVGPLATEEAAPDPQFPPDLTHQRDPGDLLERVLDQLIALEPAVLGGAGSAGNPPPLATPAAQVQESIRGLLTAYRSQASLPAARDIDGLIGRWDACIVSQICDADPTILTGYEVGKALNLTYWRLWWAAVSASGGASRTDGTERSDPWAEGFGPQRIATIRRHLETLGSVLDPRTVMIVSYSLGYWYRAVFHLILCPEGAGRREQVTSRRRGRPFRRSTTDTQEPLPDVTQYRQGFLDALDEQRGYWYDLLTGRRSPDSFSVMGIITAITTDVTTGLGTWVRRASGPILVLVGTITAIGIVAAILLALTMRVNQGNDAASAFTSLGAVVSGVISVLVARGSALFNRGAGVIQRVQGQLAGLEPPIREGSLAALATTGSSPPTKGLGLNTWQTAGQQALANVVGQIRIEEQTLAVSAPLIRFVLGSRDERDQAEDDPQAATHSFLRTIRADGNLDRLQTVFRALQRTLPQA